MYIGDASYRPIVYEEGGTVILIMKTKIICTIFLIVMIAVSIYGVYSTIDRHYYCACKDTHRCICLVEDCDCPLCRTCLTEEGEYNVR